jgi:hypothetical protein
VNFPVLISLSDADLTTGAQDDGDDIVFTDNSGTKLDHEIERYDNITGTLLSWVKVPSISNISDTVLYIYYGNNVSSNQENVAGVWASNYSLVLHLDEIVGNHSDSTSYGNIAAVLGDVNRSAVGKVDGADYFDGTGALLQVPHNEGLTGFNVSFTASCWFYIEDNTTTQTLINKYDPTGDQRGWYIQYRPWATTQIALVASDTGLIGAQQWYTAYAPDNQTWYHLDVIWEADSQPQFYIDGNISTTSGAGTISNIYNNTGTPLYIAANYASDEFNGILDEVRITNGSRTAEWIAAKYLNQYNPQSFNIIHNHFTA